MTPKTHVRLLKIVLRLSLLITALMILVGFIAKQKVMLFIGFGLIIGTSILELMLIYLIQVRCIKQRCTGRYKPGWDRDDSQKFRKVWRLIYTCDTCGTHHLTNFTFSIGLGEVTWGGETW